MPDWKHPSHGLQMALSRSSGASFFVLLWDWAITLDDEVELIWSKNNRSWLKWVFMFARYFVFVMQFCTRGMEMGILYKLDMNCQLLRVVYSSQVLVAAFAVSSLEIVLMARVYALYKQERKIGLMLITLLILDLIIAIIGMVLNLPGKGFPDATLILHLPDSFAYFGISSIVVQCIVLVLTLVKYARSNLRVAPLAKLMIRDGTLAFFMLTVVAITVVAYTLSDNTIAVTGYSWLLTLVSIATCRLIINMQRLAPSESSREVYNASTNIQFTTLFTDRFAFEDVDTDTRLPNHE